MIHGKDDTSCHEYWGIIAYVNYWIITGFALHGNPWRDCFCDISHYQYLQWQSHRQTLGMRVFQNFWKNHSSRCTWRIWNTANTTLYRWTRKMQKCSVHIRVKSGDFQDVSFWYGEEEIFSDLNLSIKPYQKVGIVGVSGSGKSTLTKLLMFYRRTKRWNTHRRSINTWCHSRKSPSIYRTHPSRSCTLSQNSRRKYPLCSTRYIWLRFSEILSIARCDTFIEKLPFTYQTLVWERGIKLSGWERQRVAIARALIAETPIIVFDEATSALDSESEQYIQEAMFDAT